MDPLGHLIEQLWAPVLTQGGVRIQLNPDLDPEWCDLESYWVVPNVRRAHLLVPRRTARVTAASLTNYRGLRLRRKNLARAAIGAVARIGLPLSSDVLAVQVSADRMQAAEQLPLRLLSRALGVDQLYAVLGIRTGDNRKAGLSLLDHRGQPVAHAKVGWNRATDQAVANEADVLRRIGGRAGAMRAPRLLRQLDYFGHPLIVTENLPLDVRGSRGRIAPINSEELFALAPIVRRAALRDTSHFRRLADRLRRFSEQPVCAQTAAAALPLLRRLADSPLAVPVTERWHGDLTPWNRARDSRGQLWVWDWEDSEVDAAAGLDALHWSFSVQRSPTSQLRRLDLAACLDEADTHLVAAGVAPVGRPLIAGAYALTVVERACRLVVQHGDWASSWISRPELNTLLAQAETLITRSQLIGSDAGAA